MATSHSERVCSFYSAVRPLGNLVTCGSSRDFCWRCRLFRFLKHLILPGAVVALSFGLVVTSLALQPNFGPLVAVGWLIVVSLPLQQLNTRPLAALIAGASILFITGVAVQVSENETLRANTDLFAEEVKEMRRAINSS